MSLPKHWPLRNFNNLHNLFVAGAKGEVLLPRPAMDLPSPFLGHNTMYTHTYISFPLSLAPSPSSSFLPQFKIIHAEVCSFRNWFLRQEIEITLYTRFICGCVVTHIATVLRLSCDWTVAIKSMRFDELRFLIYFLYLYMDIPDLWLVLIHFSVCCLQHYKSDYVLQFRNGYCFYANTHTPTHTHTHTHIYTFIVNY